MMHKNLLALTCGILMLAGCGKKDSTPAPAPAPAPKPTPMAAVTETAEAPPAPPDAPPPGPGAVVEAPSAAEQNSINSAAKGLIYPNMTAYFEDDDRPTFKNETELIQQAILVYVQMAKDQPCDAPAWPPMTDLNLLVKYKILRGLPQPPPGQRFVLDPKTRKVALSGG